MGLPLGIQDEIDASHIGIPHFYNIEVPPRGISERVFHGRGGAIQVGDMQLARWIHGEVGLGSNPTGRIHQFCVPRLPIVPAVIEVVFSVGQVRIAGSIQDQAIGAQGFQIGGFCITPPNGTFQSSAPIRQSEMGSDSRLSRSVCLTK